MIKYNFNAGPCVLRNRLPRRPSPQYVISITRASAFLRFHTVPWLGANHEGDGRPVAGAARYPRYLRYCCWVVGQYQFFTVPANLMKKKAAYLQTGTWPKAIKEAKLFGEWNRGFI